MLQILVWFQMFTLPASNLFPPFIAFSSIGSPWQSQPAQSKLWSTCWSIPGTQCSLQPRELWNLKRKFKNVLLVVFLSPASYIFEDFVDCMTKMGRPVGIWRAVMENILGPCPGNIKFLFMIGFWVKYACFLFAMHIVGPACIAQLYPCLLLFFSSPQLSWGRWFLAGGVCWNTFSKALSSSQILCASSAMFL